MFKELSMIRSTHRLNNNEHMNLIIDLKVLYYKVYGDDLHLKSEDLKLQHSSIYYEFYTQDWNIWRLWIASLYTSR